MVAVLQYTTIIKIGAQRAQRSLFAQPILLADVRSVKTYDSNVKKFEKTQQDNILMRLFVDVRSQKCMIQMSQNLESELFSF